MNMSGNVRKRLLVGGGGVACVALLTAALVARQSGAPKGQVSAGGGAGPGSLAGVALFPPEDPWHQNISKEPVDPNSDKLIASIGGNTPLHPDFGTVYEGAPIGIPYVVVGGEQPKVKVEFEYRDESDPGPYPVPPDAPIEGGPHSRGDRHVLVVDRDNQMLYELFAAYPQDGGKWWKAGSGAIWDLKKVSAGQRPKGWTSADAAGLPILPGLVRYEEAEQGAVRHALRFTARNTRRGYVYPASHFASRKTDPNLPPLGMRVRLKAGHDLSPYSPKVRAILQALKTQGMFLADNGSNWFVTGVPDPRWDDNELRQLKRVKGSDLEVVKMGEVVTE